MPPSIVAGRGHDAGREQSRTTENVLCKRGVGVQDAQYFQFRAHRLPGESTICYQAQNIRLRSYTLNNGVRNVATYLEILEFFVKRLRQPRQHLLFPADALLASIAKLEQIPLVQAIKTVRLPQDHDIGKKTCEGEQVFVRFKLQRFRNRPDPPEY